MYVDMFGHFFSVFFSVPPFSPFTMGDVHDHEPFGDGEEEDVSGAEDNFSCNNCSTVPVHCPCISFVYHQVPLAKYLLWGQKGEVTR